MPKVNNTGVLSNDAEFMKKYRETIIHNETRGNERKALRFHNDARGFKTIGVGTAIQDSSGKYYDIDFINKKLILAGAPPLTAEQFQKLRTGQEINYELTEPQRDKLLDNELTARTQQMERSADRIEIDLSQASTATKVAIADLQYRGEGNLILNESGRFKIDRALREGDVGAAMYEIAYNSNGNNPPVWGDDARNWRLVEGMYAEMTPEQRVQALERFEQLKQRNPEAVKKVENRVETAMILFQEKGMG